MFKHLILGGALALALCQTAFGTVPSTDDFLKGVEALSPISATALRQSGADYQAKCGHAPTLPQYQALARDSVVFSFRSALLSMGVTEEAEWSEELQRRHAELVTELSCDIAS